MEEQKKVLEPKVKPAERDAEVVGEDKPEEVTKEPGDPISYIVEKCQIQPEQIEAWKERYGRIEFVETCGDVYIYRGLSRMEWRELNQIPDVNPAEALAKEETITNTVLLYPKMVDFAEPSAAGLPTLIFALASKMSKFEPDFMPIRL